MGIMFREETISRWDFFQKPILGPLQRASEQLTQYALEKRTYPSNARVRISMEIRKTEKPFLCREFLATLRI